MQDLEMLRRVERDAGMNDNVREDLRFYAIITDAFGGHGGISVFNKYLIRAFLDASAKSHGSAVPRLVSRLVGELSEPPVSKPFAELAFITSVFRDLPEIRKGDVMYCAHLNLTPLAWLLRLLTGVRSFADYMENMHGPGQGVPLSPGPQSGRPSITPSAIIPVCASWPGPAPDDRRDLLPNASHLHASSPGAASDALAQRLKITGEPVLVTFGRLVSRARLEDCAPSEGLTTPVIFTGFVDEADKTDLYRLSDLCLMPSPREGFGFVFLHALDCEVPVVASSVDGNRNTVRDFLLGEMVDLDRADQLLEAVLRDIAKPDGCVPEGVAYFGYQEFVGRAYAIAPKAMAA